MIDLTLTLKWPFHLLSSFLFRLQLEKYADPHLNVAMEIVLQGVFALIESH